jgi:hypothetical protein
MLLFHKPGTTTVLSRFTITDMGPVEPKEPSQNSRARSVSVAGVCRFQIEQACLWTDGQTVRALGPCFSW